MRIAEHLYKAEAFDRASSRLDPGEDGELYVVFLMRAGTQRINAALHALNVTCEDGATSVQPGDLNHTYKPPLPAPPPEALRAAFAELAYIENLRADYVRGGGTLSEQVAGRVHAAYGRIVDDTDAVLGERRS